MRAADRTAYVAHQEDLAIRISQRALSPGESAQLEQRLAGRISSLTEERGSIIRHMRDRLRSEFPETCEERIGLWDEEAELLLTSELRDWFSRKETEIGGSDLENFLQNASQRLFSAWLSRNRGQIDGILRELAQEENSAVDALAAKVAGTPEDLLGEEDESGGMPASRSVETGTLAFGEIHVPLSRFRDPWWVELLPAGRARQFLVRRWLRKIPELAEIYRRSALSTLETAADDWVAWMDRELANRIEGMRVHVSGLLLRQPEIADLPEIESVLDRLRELVKAVLRMTPEESDGTPPTILAETTHQRPAPMRPCPICVRIERALVDFMAHFQYELSVNQGEQRRHALRSGFCPLHTWQFEAIASPQGICSGYPELLILLAKKLRVLAQDSDSALSIETGVRSLLPKETQCPACQIAAATEKAAAHDLARQLGKDDTLAAGVCTFHLRSILNAGPGLATAKQLVLAQALAFESLAEDMQNYILKHEAVRHHLTTNRERDAALAGLARLVGRRSVVVPWRTE